jgi:hypothetical protein
MRRIFVIPVLFVLLFVAGLLRAQTGENIPDHHKEAKANSANEPPIKITINPEARVSVTLVRALLQPVPCGTAADLSVKIVNQGFVTSRLEAELVGNVPEGVSLDFHAAPLKGVREEVRNLRITLTRPDPIDLTIAFRAHNETSDLGGRDRIHFLMRCRQVH